MDCLFCFIAFAFICFCCFCFGYSCFRICLFVHAVTDTAPFYLLVMRLWFYFIFFICLLFEGVYFCIVLYCFCISFIFVCCYCSCFCLYLYFHSCIFFINHSHSRSAVHRSGGGDGVSLAVKNSHKIT